MEVKISNGVITIKDYFPRKAKKAYNKALYSGITMDTDKNLSGLSLGNTDNANDALMINMIEKIVIDGKDAPVAIETLDEMKSSDIDELIRAINKVTKEAIPNE